MGHVGSFGAARRQAVPPEALDTFDYLGETFRVADVSGSGALVDIAETAMTGVDIQDMAALAMVKAQARMLVYEADFPRFWELYRTQGDDQSFIELLTDLGKYVSERATARPTPQPAVSSPGFNGIGNGTSGLSSAPPSGQPYGQPPIVLAPGGSTGYLPASPATSHTP